MAVAAAAAVLLATGSTRTSSKSQFTPARLALHEREQGNGEGDAAEAAGEAYADRAFPADSISIDQIQGAIAANAAVASHDGAKLTSKWDFIGPETLDVDRLGTQSFIKPTQWSGRVTALTVDPKCKPQECTLYVGAAGGGVWRSKNALAPTPAWKQISAGIPTNAIGSIAVDPNDPTGKTIYVGTGEANGSGDSEAGLGLYKTTDDGAHWALVPGSSAAANNRAIAWIAIDPTDAKHILIGTRSGARGLGSNATSTATPAAASPAVGIYASTDGGATFALAQAGTIAEIKFDPSDPNTVYATLGGSATGGLLRSTAGGAAGSWTPIFQENRSRLSFAAVKLPNGKTRIYLADASGGGQGAQVYRIDDASQPASVLTASNNAAWIRLSNPTDGTPGYAVYNYCNTPLVGSQCGYDMFVMSPPERPDMVVVGGLMHYEELKPYVTQASVIVGQRSNGRGVLMSSDAGVNWTDMTGDVGGESMHPDQHALAFVPGNPDQWFEGSDGGVIRSSGQYADASSQCDSRALPLTPQNLADCHAWLSRIPTELTVINAGLGTLQMNSISVSPYSPEDTAMTGTQDNGTLSYTGSPRWFLPLTGDGGNSGFDATDPHLRFHTYTGGQMDVNYNDVDPTSWLWIGDRFIVNFPESQRFYAPVISDPVVSKTIFVGAQRVWRTTDAGGDRSFLEQHCNTAIGEEPSDLLYTGACGSAADWPPLGSATLTGTAFGATKSGGNLSSIARANDGGTLWAASGSGRVLVSQNANAADPATVTFTRIDTANQPNRAVSSVFVDPTNPNHAIVTFSGYESNTPTTPGHVFDVVFDPTSGTATWTNISYDLGDQPINDAVLDTATGDLYVSTDFGVDRLQNGSTTWVQAADGLPQAAISGLTIANGRNGDRLIYAATHGRSAYRLRLK
ncbi:MAG TPA: hypothetical protein VLD16_06165 [Gaiellaceae bacterium]|nr:hypothetical protein [Gaiellaceae bacterium]